MLFHCPGNPVKIRSGPATVSALSASQATGLEPKIKTHVLRGRDNASRNARRFVCLGQAGASRGSKRREDAI